MLEVHLDPLGGIAGDMFVAAILDLRPDLEAGLIRALSDCPLIQDLRVKLLPHDDGVLTGRRFVVSREKAHGAGHAHDHDHVDWRHIREALQSSKLGEGVIQHAVAIFAHLAAAEARVHGVEPERVRFHEVGAWDSIADIVAAAWLIAEMNVTRWTVAPLPLGGGRVRTAHGLLPVPAPATAILLAGFLTIDDGVSGERVTPTGAAIVRHLCESTLPQREPRRLVGAGYGFGVRELQGMSNCVRALAFETLETAFTSERIAVLECEIDDQTAEDLAVAVDRLRAQAGILDVIQAPVFGKKGRMMTHLRVLAEPGSCDQALAALFEETATIGVRHALVERSVLERRAETIEIDGRTIRRKVVSRPSGPTAKAESDDLAAVMGTRAARAALRQRAEEIDGER
jgi:pyridinium-3,5-bisthiocarboxylic acid mononucleotide nickel chelatase